MKRGEQPKPQRKSMGETLAHIPDVRQVYFL
jgi:hypothetical protein